MSTAKKGFGDFVRRPDVLPADEGIDPGKAGVSSPSRQRGVATAPGGDGRIREITSTGRVRTYSATRQLPGITLRVTEEQWEKLKMMSIQERRPLQEILGEALAGYMRSRGLPW